MQIEDKKTQTFIFGENKHEPLERERGEQKMNFSIEKTKMNLSLE